MLPVVFGGSTMSRTQIQLCYNQFKEGRENVNDDAFSCRPTTYYFEKHKIVIDK